MSLAPPCRLLIVNADDFGLSAAVNRGIIRAHESGIVTSASLMVRQPGAAEAARYARSSPRLGVGLHLDLGEWVFEGDAWRQRYAVVADLADPVAVEREVRHQYEAFVALVGRPPTHVESHQHVHQTENPLVRWFGVWPTACDSRLAGFRHTSGTAGRSTARMDAGDRTPRAPPLLR